ncbi:MAG TPA: multicopper oxidase domain-containing protein [Acidimicrobiales bacterium]|jgi:uncharacterized cupredoxin-like copper-binding protein|nr:multicopper oxidase domain-containing protein [Acidimicrobiales bacterium]
MPVAARRVAIAVVSAVLAAGCGSTASKAPAAAGTTAATTAGAVRTIDITMFDLGYRPSDPITVAAGTTVRFVFTNTGKMSHEGVIGDQAAQDAHELEMVQMGTGDMSGMNMNGPGEITVKPGATGELTYTFSHPGHLFVGCHYPGHYAAGMHIAITVTS